MYSILCRTVCNLLRVSVLLRLSSNKTTYSLMWWWKVLVHRTLLRFCCCNLLSDSLPLGDYNLPLARYTILPYVDYVLYGATLTTLQLSISSDWGVTSGRRRYGVMYCFCKITPSYGVYMHKHVFIYRIWMSILSDNYVITQAIPVGSYNCQTRTARLMEYTL
jgi:hypothetical protein